MSETNSSSTPHSNPESVDQANSSVSVLDPDLEELCQAQNRDLARVAAFRLLIPLVLASVVVAIRAWTYVQLATTRKTIREQLKDDPARTMEMLSRASGKDGD